MRLAAHRRRAQLGTATGARLAQPQRPETVRSTNYFAARNVAVLLRLGQQLGQPRSGGSAKLHPHRWSNRRFGKRSNQVLWSSVNFKWACCCAKLCRPTRQLTRPTQTPWGGPLIFYQPTSSAASNALPRQLVECNLDRHSRHEPNKRLHFFCCQDLNRPSLFLLFFLAGFYPGFCDKSPASRARVGAEVFGAWPAENSA